MQSAPVVSAPRNIQEEAAPVLPAEDENESDQNMYSSDDSSSDSSDYFANLPGVDEPISTSPNIDHPRLGVVLILMLDWMSSHHSTNRAAQDVWNMLKSLLPADSDLPTFNLVLKILKRHMDRCVEKIDMCVNGCVAFHDFVNPEILKLASCQPGLSRRTVCPTCGEDRYITNTNGSRSSRKVFYYLPCSQFFQDIFRQTDLIPYLQNNYSPVPVLDGHVRKSTGWNVKVTNNPNINSDSRHQPVVLSADGVPYFKEKNDRSGWPFVLQLANLPPALNSDLSLCHLIALGGCEYLDTDPATGKIIRVKKEHASLNPILLRITDELLTLEKRGVACEDFSLPVSDPRRKFRLKSILMYVIGDYPAQGKMSGFTHQGHAACHWCEHRFETVVGSQYAIHNRRHLPPEHTMRQSSSFPT